jgi:hypothetical protein
MASEAQNWYEVGCSNLARGQYDSAVLSFAKASMLDPDYPLGPDEAGDVPVQSHYKFLKLNRVHFRPILFTDFVYNGLSDSRGPVQLYNNGRKDLWPFGHGACPVRGTEPGQMAVHGFSAGLTK